LPFAELQYFLGQIEDSQSAGVWLRLVVVFPLRMALQQLRTFRTAIARRKRDILSRRLVTRPRYAGVKVIGRMAAAGHFFAPHRSQQFLNQRIVLLARERDRVSAAPANRRAALG